MARVARRNRLQSVQVDGAGQFARAVPNSLLSFPVGSFENAGDSRQYILQNFHRVCNTLNASMSVDPIGPAVPGLPGEARLLAQLRGCASPGLRDSR